MERLIIKKWDARVLPVIIIILFCVFEKKAYGYNSWDNEPAKNNEYVNENDSVYGTEFITEEIEYDEIQYVIDELFNEGNDFNFSKFIGDLIEGETDLSLTEILTAIKDGVMAEIKANINNLTSIIAIAIIAAIFTSISQAFKDNQVADAGFYVTYMLLFSVLTASFVTISGIASDTIAALLEFMEVLVPTYMMTLALSSGGTTSYVYYQLTLFLISFINVILLKIILPMINIHFIIALANNLSKEDMLSKLSELLADGVRWILKALIAVVIALNTLSGLIPPVSDELKKSGILKTAKAIPGVGEVIGGVAESVISASILLKNAVGVAGVVVILILCAVPICKLGITTLVYKMSSAIIQPISDKRLINCISAAAESSSLLLNTVIVGLVLFIITITIIALSTT